MKKQVNKFTKYLLLFIMIIYDLMTPITVLADSLKDNTPNKGDIGINNEVTNNGNSASVSVGSLTNSGDIQVTKTVTKTDVDGTYKIDFDIKGKEVTSSSTKDVYVVVVFDKSGSMSDTYYKWSNAVTGAKTFASTLLTKLPNANIALVTFSGNSGYYDDAYNDTRVVREFANQNLDNVNFGSPSGGTNLQGGLYEADKLLKEAPADAEKIVVIISDGKPTYYYDENGYTHGDGGYLTKETYNATIAMANTIKSYGEIFTIGYSLPSGTVYKSKTAKDVLTEVSSSDTSDSKIKHYVNAEPDAIAEAFTNIADDISVASAGTNAVLTDNIGDNFTIEGQDGKVFTSDTIKEITEDGIKLSFNVNINKDSDGWQKTNKGFSLKYTDPNGVEQTLTCDEDPMVYWEANTYNYKVNYYKDSLDTEPIATDTRSATNGTTINVDNVEKDKYLNNNDLGTVGYEYDSLNPESITITNDGEVKEINVLYTIEKFDYVVNYYYANENNTYNSTPDGTTSVNNINYGTKVNTSDYYLENSQIKEGYILDTNKTNNSSYTITDDSVQINIYYKRDNYEYTVKYYFDSNIDTDFTKTNNEIYGNIVYAKDNYLSSSDLNTKNNEDNKDYFLDPNNSNNTNDITIGINNNNLNIYYISTYVSEEETNKTSDTTKITSSNQLVDYTVNYSSTIKNLKEGEKVLVTITDTLPYEIDETNSYLAGGIYNSQDKTITWTFEETSDKFYSEYNINKEVTYKVIYKDFASISANDTNTISNSAQGTTTTAGKTTKGDTDKTTTVVEINGNLIVHHYEKGTTNSLYSDESSNGLVGVNYTTNYRTDIFGYTVDKETMPINKEGKYVDGTTEVTYYYTKNDGTIEEPDTEKTGPSKIDSIDSTFDYTINATGTVKDYVGSVKVTAIDTLPNKIDTEKSTIDNRCTYDGNKTITCEENYNITKEDYTNDEYNINEVFTLKLVYTDINSDKVTNNAKTTIKLDNVEKTTEDENETVIEKGKVTAIYVENGNESNILASSETTTDLVGTNYATNSKEIFGYTLTSEPSNKTGKYTKDEITVKYLYTKNDGTIDTPVVVKEGPQYVTSIDSIFNYTLKVDTKVTDYVGEATLKVTDILPYEVDKTKSSIDQRCTYTSDKEITCTEEYNITEEDYINNEYKINEAFDLNIVFKNIDSDKVTNSMNAIISLDKVTKDNDTDVTTEVEKGKVTAIYVENGNESNILASSETTTDLVGANYATNSKEIFGYTLTSEPSNKTGKYTKDEITVTYYYTKNDGTIEEPNTEKVSNETINSIEDTFEYTIIATGTVKDYVGTIKIKAIDNLPYAIDEEKSTIDKNCKYNSDKLTIICEKDLGTITEEDYVDGEYIINEEFDLDLVYLGIEDSVVTNSASTEIILENNNIVTDDETETTVEKGTIIINYVDTKGNELAESISIIDLVGKDYTTTKKEFENYFLSNVKGNAEGKIVEGVTEVTYVYDFVPLPPQTGFESEENNTTNYIMYILSMIMLLALGFKATKED